MRSPSPGPGTIVPDSVQTGPENKATRAAKPVAPEPGSREQAAMGPIPEAVSVEANPLPVPTAASAAEAQGRRTLSTAFVMTGPDRLLTVELRNGRVLVLRDVVMRPKDYCGVQVLGGAAAARYCGKYIDVAAARPGSAGAPAEPNLAISDLVESPRSPAKRN